VFEDARTLAFMDINPVRPGHVLVIPKAHRPQIWHLGDAEFSAVYRRLPSLVRALARATRADAIDVFNLNGPAGGQTVFHLHVHLVPVHRETSPVRRKGRGVTLTFEQQRVERHELNRIARRIRARLRTEPRVGDPRRPPAREGDRHTG